MAQVSMPRLIMRGAAVVLAAAVPGSFAPRPSAAGDAALAGVWTGEMRQVDASGEKTYPMTVTFAAAGSDTDYPSLSCGGKLIRIGTAHGLVIFSETITRGSIAERPQDGCINGVVSVQRLGETMILGWFGVFTEQPYSATATLKLTAGK